jgi:hypothetical protein
VVGDHLLYDLAAAPRRVVLGQLVASTSLHAREARQACRDRTWSDVRLRSPTPLDPVVRLPARDGVDDHTDLRADGVWGHGGGTATPSEPDAPVTSGLDGARRAGLASADGSGMGAVLMTERHPAYERRNDEGIDRRRNGCCISHV